ncbi:hypothetical protein BDK51DRAFT_51345, partial [Blyttiomyces helicus]
GLRLSDSPTSSPPSPSSASTIVTAAPAPTPIDLAARGQCPNSLVLTCAGLIYKKDFVGTLEKCGQCIKESTLCVEIYLAAKVNKDICKFAKNMLKCDAIRFTGLGENGFRGAAEDHDEVALRGHRLGLFSPSLLAHPKFSLKLSSAFPEEDAGEPGSLSGPGPGQSRTSKDIQRQADEVLLMDQPGAGHCSRPTRSIWAGTGAAVTMVEPRMARETFETRSIHRAALLLYLLEK